jgi:type IV fimbrial biogenesis protein FimT
MRNNAGVTLIELLFGLAIVAILAGLAAPGFHQSLRASAVRAATYELLAGLQQTRGSAILEARPGLLCPSDAAGNCLPAATAGAFWRWSTEAPGRPPEVGGRALPEGIMARASRSPIRFSPTARSASNATLTICDLRGIATPRAIVVNVSGRARVAVAEEAACH